MADYVQKLDYLKRELTKIFKTKRYIARSEYLYLLPDIENTSEFFTGLSSANLLDAFCNNNGLDFNSTLKFIDFIANINENVEAINDEYVESVLIKDKDYFDNILKAVDPNVVLDNEQRTVAVTDEDYCLVIAGAGAGKTTTIAAKVKYLVEKRNVNPEDILVISFTNEAVRELQSKINKTLGIPCVISTFHSAGNYVIKKESVKPLKIAQDDQIYYVLQEYFKDKILQNEVLIKKLLLFFSEYFEAPYAGESLEDFFVNIARSDYTTLKGDLESFKTNLINEKAKKKVTIKNEVVRSYEEVKIANFLFLNGIDYEYEPIYEYLIENSNKTYTPDFLIKQGDKKVYLEHFGIKEDGTSTLYNKDELDLYKKAIRDKLNLHKQHGTKLIYTFSSFKDGRDLITHLKEKLISSGIELHPLDEKDVFKNIISNEENRYIKKLIRLVNDFISAFKTNGYTQNYFEKLYLRTENVRNRLFIDICSECFNIYQNYLERNNMIDFQDMINKSSVVLRNLKNNNQTIPYKYIIIDEYQDISLQRFNFINELHKVCNAKVIAVGDDWQSIFAFSGSDIDLFTDFSNIFGYAKVLNINHTYRNSQELIDIAGKFVQANPKQIKKQLVSPKHILDPVIICTYDDRPKNKGSNYSGVLFQAGMTVNNTLEKIAQYAKKEGRNPFKEKILILGRYNFDARNLESSGLFEFDSKHNKLISHKYPKLDLYFKTAHSSKGLTYDDVVIINCKNEFFGFPSKIVNDPVLSLVVKEDRSMTYAEDRRLFYVAMTRTKNRVFMLTPEHTPSDFVIEIKKRNNNIVQVGDMNLNYKPSSTFSSCPICGFPLIKRNAKGYGKPLWICSNEPELCSFMTNKLEGGKLSVCKCDKCNNGYLIVRKGVDDYFLGCSNWKADGTGCFKTISRQDFYRQHGYKYIPNEAIKTTHYKEDDDIIRTNVSKEGFDEVTIDNLPPVFYDKVCLNDVLFRILHSIYEINYIKFVGRLVVANFCKGNTHDTIIKHKLNKIKDFGCLADLDFSLITRIIDWLIENHFILEGYSGPARVLFLTHSGIYYNTNITTEFLNDLKENLSKQADTAWAYFE